MKIRFILSLMLLGTALIFLNLSGVGGCGGSSGTSSDAGSGGSTGGGTGTASVSSLSNVPSVDISNIDYSTSTSSASKLTVDQEEEALTLKDATDDKPKGLGQNFNAVGNASRAGCEANMHKREIKRHSKETALDFCYAKAMEKAKLIAPIPTDSYLYISVVPPKDLGDNKKKACDGIPKDHKDEIDACLKGGGDEGPGADGFKIKVGRIGKGLQMDMCEGKTPTLVHEATYEADGAKYTAKTVRIGSFNGHNEKSRFDGTIDLGTNGKVTDGIPDLGDGTATATSVMDGGFGNGTITFAATGTSKAVTVSGVFNGKFKEPRSGLETSFTGKAYAQMDNSTGCAKFSFTGPPPPMSLKDMIPFDIPGSQLDNFLQNFGLQLGLSLTKDNYKKVVLCPNPNFDPANPDTTGVKKPMVVAGSTGCTSVTHTGVECFSITNGTEQGQFGQSKVKQTFTIIANSGSTYYTAVNAFDLSTLSDKKGTIAFVRNWDCQPETGKSFTELDFSKFTQEQATAAQAALQDCFKIEDEARGDNGMGDHNCNEQQQQGDINNFAKKGPPDQGKFGGACKKGSTTCTKPGRDTFFINPTDSSKNEYCLVSQGGCDKFTVTGTSATGLSLKDPDGSTVTAINFTQSGNDPATVARISMTWTGGENCTVDCAMSQPKFDKPGDFDPNAKPPSGGKQGETGFIPKPCIGSDGKPVTPEKCRAICSGNPDCMRRD